jgi:hypothetical protein
VPFSVEFFYQWLVARDVETGILREIAAAVSGVEVAEILDVSVAQMFLSRAIQRQQRRSLLSEGVDAIALALPNEGDEEDDEL